MTKSKQEVFDLSEHAVLVEFHKGYWQGKCPADEVAREIEEKHGAAAGTVKADKYMIDRDVWLEGQRICKEAYAYWKDHTTGWGDSVRLVRSDQFSGLVEKLIDYRNKLMDHADQMVEKYDVLLTRAKERLNGMWVEGQFPESEELREKYHMEWTVMPITRTDDIRLKGISAAQIDDLVEDTKQQIQDRLQEAQQELITRLTTVVKNMVNALSGTVKTEGAKKPKVFRDTLVGNIAEVCDVLPSLNITQDKRIDEMISKVKATLAVVSPQDLRDNPKAKMETVQKASGILDDLRNFKV